MAAYWTASAEVQRNFQGFRAVLTSVACEWFLILLLLIDGVLSYLLTKFAHRCELQMPCLLCSRLDHILGDEKPQFYWSLFCSNHRVEISSMVSCLKHGKLADVRTMCEDCLLSFAAESPYSLETHRLLLGKMGSNIGDCSTQNSTLKRDVGPRSGKRVLCSCCDKPLKSRNKALKLLLKPSGSRSSRPKIPLPRMPNRSRLHRRDGLKRTKDRGAESSTCGRPRKISSVDVLSSVEYDGPRITSDSELLFFGKDDLTTIYHDQIAIQEEKTVESASQCKPKGLSIGVPSERRLPKSSNSGSSLSDLNSRHNVGTICHVQSVGSDVVRGKGLGPGDCNLHQGIEKSNSSIPSDLISLYDARASSSISQDALHGSAGDSKSKSPLPKNIPDFMSLDVTPPAGLTSEKGIVNYGHSFATEKAEVSSTNSVTDPEPEKVVSSSASSQTISADSSDADESAVNAEGREEAGSFVEQSQKENPDRVTNEHSPSSSHYSCIDEKESSTNIAGHPLNDNDEEIQAADTSDYNRADKLLRSLSMERSEYSLESLHESLVSDIEGESMVDHLKRQVEYDQKRINALYKELDEERNASAIAANQAMAMITKLQEEKATLHMEAMQYLREMEEQAEHDAEALEKANDLLAEKEKDIQDLEAEIEFYRYNFPDESVMGSTQAASGTLDGENMASCTSSTNVNLPDVEKSADVSRVSGRQLLSSSWFEGEKVYILNCLKSLEMELHQATNGGHNQGESIHREGSQLQENTLSRQESSPKSNGQHVSQEAAVASVGDNYSNPEDDNDKDCNIVTFKNEITELNERLKSLEAVHNVLKHTVNSLQNGNQGLQFVQEIAQQLQELWNIGLRIRCQTVS